MTTILAVEIPIDNPNSYRVPVALYDSTPLSDYVNMSLIDTELRSAIPSGIDTINGGFVDVGDPAVRYRVVIVTFDHEPTQDDTDAIDAVITAHNPAAQTPEQQSAAYLAENLEHADLFNSATDALDIGIATLDPVTIAAYRTVLLSVYASLAPLTGTRFETHFNRELTALGFMPPLSAANVTTLAQCQQLDNMLHVWLTARKVDALRAQLGG